MQMPLIVPLFLEDNQFTSTLTLVNNSTATTYADVTLRGLDGNTIASKRVDFTPHSQRRVDIINLLDKKGSSAIAGSILVMQSPALAGPSILAVLSMTYLGSADPNYIDEEIFMPSMTGSQVLQGVADSGDGSPILAISSLAASVQHVQIQCLGKDGAAPSRRITLAGGETLVTNACTGSDIQDRDLTAILEGADNNTHGPEGIRVVSDAMPGSFAAFGLARHKENGDRFFSSVLFADPKTLNSPNTVFTGVPVGNSSSLLPEGHYVPELTLTNFSSKELHVHTTFAHMSGVTPSAQDVGSLSVPAHKTRELVLSSLQGDPTLQNSFVIESDGSPGDLIAKFVAKGNSQLHELELQAKDEAEMANAGAHPWSIEGNTDSTLLLFNHSTTPQTFTVTVSGLGFEWQKEYELESMQTEAIGIRELIQEQVEDDKGNTLPKNATSGEAGWLVTNFAKGSGRLLQSDRLVGMARNFSCGYSGLLCGSSVVFDYTTLADGGIAEFADITGLTCTSGEPNACSGQQTGTANFTTKWVSLSTNIASISGSSTSPPVNLSGVAVGTSQVNGHISSEYCQSGGGGTASVVAIPTNFHYVTATADDIGDLAVTYAWNSSSGNINDLSSCTISELVTYPGNPSPKYYPPSPPYNDTPGYPSPFVSSVPGNNAASGNTASFVDLHTINDDFVKPYSTSFWAATQYYRFTCTGYVVSGSSNINLEGPLSISSSIQSNGAGGWEYIHYKTGVPVEAIINPLP
jgi:hypothetical protein